jgi:acetate kinase
VVKRGGIDGTEAAKRSARRPPGGVRPVARAVTAPPVDPPLRRPEGEARPVDAFVQARGEAERPSGHGQGEGAASSSSVLAIRVAPKKIPGARKVLVLNSGSSSIKFQVRREGGGAGISGNLERIGEDESRLKLKVGDQTFEIARPVRDHDEALAVIAAALTDPAMGAMKLAEISAVGHRVVHGGPELTEPAAITPEVEAKIAEYAQLAPLHNPPALDGIRAARGLFGEDVPQVAVFDTGFHSTLPSEASSYALPKDWRDAGVRRFGFHGISVENATRRAAKMLNRPAARTNLIVCHLGNGASITAVEGGRSRDTSMGMTPLAGIMMGTRPGDVDVGAIFHMAKNGKSLDEIERDLNKRSGLLGLSDGLSNDVRELLAAEERGDPHAKLALEKYTEDIVEQVGAFFAKLSGKVHAIVFTGGVGENSAVIRQRIMEHFKAFGFQLDAAKNKARVGDEADLARGPGPRILVVRADEEGAIAEHAFRLTRKRPAGAQRSAD